MSVKNIPARPMYRGRIEVAGKHVGNFQDINFDNMAQETFSEKLMLYALMHHSQTQHLYDNGPYAVHLEMAVQVAEKFIHLIPTNDVEVVLAATWCHDLIEDCRINYNDLKREAIANGATEEHAKMLAEIVYACTNEKGRYRADRQSNKFYTGLKNQPYAVFVKLCDRIANMTYSKKKLGSADKLGSMYAVYQKELNDFHKKLYDDKYNSMFLHLIKI